ncbi:uncharacterized protein LAESUDRAFT_705569 [Laetiporus sulphureus 93-53]|uniref:Uncharacterized protein n=1 Tax=Laetiporus sulphureus 93-53 TaxID=1314785 RepID=A0A165CIF0_9APHY|nr:uncharacterized protein LAESUDRAFT_705569 [Laetiporus sulphureus 93-53]KZT02870.1 hypothetical protein LAESUDRAFT_705569 [Laetiporus sulphureus 93-53]
MRLSALQIAAAATYTLSFLQMSSAHPSKPVRFARHASHARDLSAQPSVGPVSLRQHHEPRAVVDVCANIDANVLSDLNLLTVPLSALVGLDVCLCLSMLPLALTTDVQLETLVPLLGINNLTALLTAAIDGAPDSKHCTYPQHSKPLCSSSDPCGWECESPYVKEGDECVCQWPYTSCNGVCGSFTHGCGSSTPKARRLGTNLERRIETSIGVTTLEEAQKTCKEDETVCGVHAGSNLAYECINVGINVESCKYSCLFKDFRVSPIVCPPSRWWLRFRKPLHRHRCLGHRG